ncbi:NAD(P)-binding domain-containing protein [Halpernia sp.]|uniref:NAD(P)-binding domain-containing protein n=1 Tax=Halpernia sp. TaxID=2782209 RepID=UPI003A932151
MKKLGIIGCGWLGKKIAKKVSGSFEIFTTTTSKEKLNELKTLNFNPHLILFSDQQISNYQQIFDNQDIIIITVPFSQRTPISTLKIRFQNIINFIGDFKGQLFLCSSTGIYPQIEEIITENSVSENLLNQSIFSIEKLMQENYPQLNILRFGGLMGDDRIFSKYYQNKEIAEPHQVVNHTHFEDICKVFLDLIKLNINCETFNFVSPNHPSKIEVYNCQTKNNCEKIDDQKFGKRISSVKIIERLNYKFIHPNPKYFK